METVDTKIQAPAEAVAAPKPAVAKHAPKPAEPAKPAENEVKPIVVEPAALRQEMERLKAEGMDFLECLTGVDWMEEGLGCIYTLTSTETGKMVHVQTATLDRENPLLPSVSDLWAVANIYEREVFDFYGIRFTGHPDMRRVFLREDWVGYPFRKDDETEKSNTSRS